MSGTSALAYLRWHARDALPRAIAPVAIFLGVGGIPLWSLISREGLEAARTSGRFQDALLQVFGQTMTLSMTLGALVLLSGLVALDRERGHVRFLFSTPVVAWRHYLTRAVVAVLLFALCFMLIPVGFGAIVTPVPLLPVLLSALLFSLLYGALALLVGAITQRDGPVMIVTVVLGTVLQQLGKAEQLPGWAITLGRLFPPFVAAGDVRGAWLAERAVERGDLLLVLAYSLGMLIASLYVIHRAPLVR